MSSKNNKLEIFNYIFAFSIIYLTSAVEISFKKDSTIGAILKSVMTFIPFLYCLNFYLSNKISNKVFKIITLTIFFFIIESLTCFSTVGELTLYIIKFILFFLFCYLLYIKNKDFDKYLYYTISFIALYSIIFYFIINIFHIGLPYKVFQIVGTKEFYYDYYDIYFYRKSFDTVINIGPYSFDRLSSLFWEPGVYGIYLIYALYINLFTNNIYKKNKRIIFLILVINILFTFSTTALCIMLAFFAIKIIKNKQLKPYFKILIIIPTVSITLVGIFYIIISKINKNGLGEVNSFFARISDITVGFTLFFQNIISGTGFNNAGEFKELQGYGRDCSNGLIIWLFTTGTVGIFFASYPYIINLKKLKKKSYPDVFYYLVYIIMVILLNMTEPIFTSPLMTYVLAKEYALLCKRGKIINESITYSS